MPFIYQPFDYERFNRELRAVNRRAMRQACVMDRDQIIDNVKGGVSPLGGAAKANSPETLKRKKGSTPLIGDKRTLVKKSNYPIREIKQPGVVGFALTTNTPDRLIGLARLGYPVFWMDQTQAWMGQSAIIEALAAMPDNFRGAPR
jgi:hypothetical protein